MCNTALSLSKCCKDGNARLLAMASCSGMGFWDDRKAEHAKKKGATWSADALAAAEHSLHREVLAWQ
jgi:hypothetical protein